MNLGLDGKSERSARGGLRGCTYLSVYRKLIICQLLAIAKACIGGMEVVAGMECWGWGIFEGVKGLMLLHGEQPFKLPARAGSRRCWASRLRWKAWRLVPNVDSSSGNT
jgi:hypothetical protein